MIKVLSDGDLKALESDLTTQMPMPRFEPQSLVTLGKCVYQLSYAAFLGRAIFVGPFSPFLFKNSNFSQKLESQKIIFSIFTEFF